MLTLTKTGWKCTEEFFEDVMTMFGINLNNVEKNEHRTINRVDRVSSFDYTLSTLSGVVEITRN